MEAHWIPKIKKHLELKRKQKMKSNTINISKSSEIQNDSALQKFLNKIEKAGNALPHPSVLFLYLFGFL